MYWECIIMLIFLTCLKYIFKFVLFHLLNKILTSFCILFYFGKHHIWDFLSFISLFCFIIFWFYGKLSKYFSYKWCPKKRTRELSSPWSSPIQQTFITSERKKYFQKGGRKNNDFVWENIHPGLLSQ